MLQLESILRPLFSASTDLSFAGIESAASEELDASDGFVVGNGRRRARFVRYPDGEFRAVDLDFDVAVLDDPEAIPLSERRAIHANAQDLEARHPRDDSVQRIAVAMLAACPGTLVAITRDAKNRLLGATITPARRGLTAGVFRVSLRSLPDRAKNVTFVTEQPVPTGVQASVAKMAEISLIHNVDYLVVR